MKAIMISLLVSLLVIAMPSYNSNAEESNMLKNGSFEVDTNGDEMADYWQFAGDSGVTATWSRDKGFKGQYSQKINCTGFEYLSPASHVMLCQMNTIQLEKGKWYRISFNAKQEGIRGHTVQVAISNTKLWSNCGLQDSFRVSQDWKPFEFVFQATETITENTRLQFWYTSVGTFWLDDVQLENSEPISKRFTEVLPVTDSVNLIPNSSFECRSSGWGSIADLPGWGGNLNQLVGELDKSTSQNHGSSFKIALTPDNLPMYYFDYFQLYRIPIKAPLLANQGWVSVQSDSLYTLSAYMKAGSEGLTGILSILQAFRGNMKKEIQLSTEWKRYSFTFKPQADQIFVAMGLDLNISKQETGTVWIDSVQLEKNSEAMTYHPRNMVEIGLETSQLGNLFTFRRATEEQNHYGNEPVIKATLFNADETSHSVTLQWQTTDFDDKVVYESSYTVDLPQGKSAEVPINSGVQKKGFYRLRLQSNDVEVALNQSLRFAIIDPYDENKVEECIFGMNHAYPWSHLLDLSKQIGMCWFRDWSLKWQDVESEKGKFDFTETDFQINRVLKNGLNVLPLLPFPSSNWSSSAGSDMGSDRYPGNRERMAYMPKDLNEFADYVRTTVKHYQDRLHVWEIMNEPIYTDYSLPRAKDYRVEDYVKLLQVAYQSVKEADPKALVIGGIAGGANTYTQEFIKAGGLQWVDALNLHIYPGLSDPEEYEESLKKLREQIGDKPIWFTEGAYYADDDMPFEPYSAWLKPLASELEASECQVKFNTILMAYGVEKIIYHSGTPGSLNNESLDGIFFEWAGTPRKMLVVQSAMSNLFKTPIHSLGRIDAPEKVEAYGFETDNQTVIVAWAKENTKLELSLAGKSWQIIDIQGNELKTDSVTLAERPVYFVSKEKGLKDLPFREAGDLMIGYSEFRTDLPGGLTANRYTTRAYLVNSDGTGRRPVAEELTKEPYTWTQFAGWSPDGTIAIIGSGWVSPENAEWEEKHETFRMTEGYLYDMYLMEIATGKLTNVTAVDRVSIYNAGLWFWPKNPNKLGFNPLINGIQHPFNMDIDGHNKKDLSEGEEGFTYGYSASPDGEKISYHKDYKVYIANADGTNSTLIETGNPFNFAPQWSPDGQWLLFVSGEHYDCHPYIVKRDDTDLHKIADRQGYSGVMTTIDVYNFHGGSSDVPVWSKDGQWVYYTAKVGDSVEMMRVDLKGNIQQLTHSKPGVFNYHPVPSPDGKLLIIGSTRSGRRQLYIMKPDGSDIYPITNVEQGYGAMHPSWQPQKKQ